MLTSIIHPCHKGELVAYEVRHIIMFVEQETGDGEVSVGLKRQRDDSK